MKFGIGTGPQNTSWQALLEVWRKADSLGYDSAWNFDHLLPLSPNPEDPIYEGWTMLAAMASETSRAKIGVMVSSNTFRHPALVAKMCATVDAISGGRLIVGMGAGYFEPEHDAFGIHLGSIRERADRLAESLQILRGLWTERRFTFEGSYYTITDAPCEPKPVQSPHPPIMVGGSGEKLTLRTTALYADQWNMPPGDTGVSPEEFAAKYAVLRQRCDEVGRDPAEIETNLALVVVVNDNAGTALERRRQIAEAFGLSEENAAKMVLAGDPAGVIEQLAAYEAAGVQHFDVILIDGINYDDIELFAGEVIPAFR